MTEDRRLSRRDFLRFRRTERGRVLDVSCRALFMRLADATIDPEPVPDYDAMMGEPPLVVERRTTVDILDSLDADLRDAQVLRLLEPEWLEGIQEASRIQDAIESFRMRGGVVEKVVEVSS